MVEPHTGKPSTPEPSDTEKGSVHETGQPSSSSKEPFDAASTEDPNIVSWEGDNDPKDPRNWTSTQKWTMVGIVSSISFITQVPSRCPRSRLIVPALSHPRCSRPEYCN